MSTDDDVVPEDTSFLAEVAECQLRLAALGREPGSRDERIWAAGFFDGEGTVSARVTAGFDCSVEQARIDLINLVRFRSAVQVGRIVPLKPRKNPNSSPAARWLITSYADLDVVFAALGEFLNPTKLDGRMQQRKETGTGPLDGFARALAAQSRSALSRDKVPPGAIVYEPKGAPQNGDGQAI